MEYLAYSYMFMANEEATETPEYHLPEFDFNWRQLIKSSAWLVLAGISVLLAAVSQAQLASAAYINTNGSCLRVRTDPSLNARVVDCIPNGRQITNRGTINGFVRLGVDRYVSARWVGDRSNSNPNTGTGGVGGSYILRQGSRGAAVSQVQRALGDLTVDGIYGSATARRVRQFQANNGLLVDGVVGAQTRRALGL